MRGFTLHFLVPNSTPHYFGQFSCPNQQRVQRSLLASSTDPGTPRYFGQFEQLAGTGWSAPKVIPTSWLPRSAEEGCPQPRESTYSYPYESCTRAALNIALVSVSNAACDGFFGKLCWKREGLAPHTLGRAPL